MIGGGAIMVYRSGLGAVRRRQYKQPRRQPDSSPSSIHSPLQRSISFGSVFFMLVVQIELRSHPIELAALGSSGPGMGLVQEIPALCRTRKCVPS